ncbi:histidine phosphatase family protein [Vibrio sp. PP-XX7]
MIDIYLVRHGKTIGPAALYGRTDVAVETQRQDRIATKLLDQYVFSHVYTSPLQRCRRLAGQLIVQQPGLFMHIEPDFQEMDFGRYDGIPYEQLTDSWNELEQFWHNPAEVVLPEAEPLDAVQRRVTLAWEALIARCQQNTLVIAHGGTIRLILAHVLGIDWKNPNWYKILHISNQSLSHLQLLWDEEMPYLTVKSIGVPL